MRKRTLSRPFEPIDEYLDTQDLFRKQVPRDASSLFRAVAEKICLSQTYHMDIRNICLDYMLIYRSYFQNFITDPLEIHVLKMRSPLEWPTNLELISLSLFFKLDFYIYLDDCMPARNYTNFGFNKHLTLYKDSGSHYDLIYPQRHSVVAGFCQALVYQMLYTKVFKQDNVMSIVDQMLHDNTSRFRMDSTNSTDVQDIFRIVEQVTDPNRSQDHISLDLFDSPIRDVTPPFPYRVAKALDPDIYRNSDFDIYTAIRKEARYGPYDSRGLQIGVKVIAKTWLFPDDNLKGLTNKEMEQISEMILNKNVLHGHIQTMCGSQKPVEIYAEEFGKRIVVPYNSLEKCSKGSPISGHDLTQYPMSPPAYRMLSKPLAKKPMLPFPDYMNSPGRGKKKKFGYPLPLQSSTNDEQIKMPKECEIDQIFRQSVQQHVSGDELENIEKTNDIKEGVLKFEQIPTVMPCPIPLPPPQPPTLTSGSTVDYQGWYIVNPPFYPFDPMFENLNKNFQNMNVDNYTMVSESPTGNVPMTLYTCQQVGCNGQCVVPNYVYPQPVEASSMYGYVPLMYGTPPPGMIPTPLYYEPNQW